MKQLIFWIGHAIVCFIPTYFFGWQAGMVGGLYIELAQIDVYYFAGNKLKTYHWKDTFIDLIFDAIGIIIAVILK